MFKAIADGFGYLFDLLGRFGKYILDGILWLLSPILDFFAMIFYFIYKLIAVLASVVRLVIDVGRLLLGLVTGLFKTIIGFNFTGSTTILPDSYQKVFLNLQPILKTLQVDKVAYLFQFGIWIFTAIIAMKIIGNMRGGGSGENFVDSIFDPVFQFLDMMSAKLGEIRHVAAKGIRLDDYFGIFGILGPEWAGVINSLLAALLFLFILFVIQKNSGVLLWFKSLIKWW